jgi:uncharacterized membrane protein
VFVENLPEWLQIFLLSMIPGLESRFVVPLIAIHQFHWEWWQAFPIAVAGNIFLVPFILKFFQRVERFLHRFPSWSRTMNWGFPLIRKRADSKIRKYETVALLLFVAVPLPFTGAGLGSLIAYLFDLRISRSFLMIFIGVIISTSITTFIYLTGMQWFFFHS